MNVEPKTLRVGIDVGGTFTDLAALESWTGRVVCEKVPSTPREPHRAALAALVSLCGRYDPPPRIEFLAHATTIATNALLGQIGLELPRTALVTTDGFRDVIEIGRQNRSEVYNLFVERPRPLVAREDRLTVRERVDHTGTILCELEDAEIERVSALLRERDVAAVAICLLHSYANDSHERRLAEALTQALPGVAIARSSEVDPQYREYERFSTTVVNAVLAPIVQVYLEQLIEGLGTAGIDARLYVMRSDGALADAEHVTARPAALIESGPASGVVAAAALGTRLDLDALLAFDMGGTTAKAGVVVDGGIQVAYEFEAAGTTHSGRAVRGSGYPVRFPFVDLAEVSAGGGTIAWIDDAESLRVGPLSAGADPGPACYGRSPDATVTDANIVLGRLNSQALLGGTFPIDAALARAAIERLSSRVQLSVEATAAGIVRLIDHAMAKAVRIVTLERGLDPRDFTLVAFGGGGPLHACAIADELGIARIVVPAHPGCFSACGLLDASVGTEDATSILRATGELDGDVLGDWFQRTERDAGAALIDQGAQAESIQFQRRCDARYRGQSFELTIEHDPSALVMEERFHEAHRRRYGYDIPGEIVEIVNARLTGQGHLGGSIIPSAVGGSPSVILSLSKDDKEVRTIWDSDAFIDVAVLQRDAIAEGAAITGPAIIEEYDCTTYVAPGWTAKVAGDVLVLERTSS